MPAAEALRMSSFFSSGVALKCTLSVLSSICITSVHPYYHRVCTHVKAYKEVLISSRQLGERRPTTEQVRASSSDTATARSKTGSHYCQGMRPASLSHILTEAKQNHRKSAENRKKGLTFYLYCSTIKAEQKGRTKLWQGY